MEWVLGGQACPGTGGLGFPGKQGQASAQHIQTCLAIVGGRVLIYPFDLCVCVCMYACMYACMHVCMYACMHVCMYVCMHVCMYVCNVCKVCVYVCGT